MRYGKKQFLFRTSSQGKAPAVSSRHSGGTHLLDEAPANEERDLSVLVWMVLPSYVS